MDATQGEPAGRVRTSRLNNDGDEDLQRPSIFVHGKDPAACPGRDGSYPLLCHLLDTAMVAEHLWESHIKSTLRNRLQQVLGPVSGSTVLMLLAALHDIGKANPWFQYQERMQTSFSDDLATATGLPRTPEWLRGSLRSNRTDRLRRHEFISFRAVSGRWPSSDILVRGPDWLSTIVGGHHGRWKESTETTEDEGSALISGWTDEQAALLRAVEEAVGLQVNQVPPLEKNAQSSMLFVCLSGLLTLADWLASDDAVVEDGKEHWAKCVTNEQVPHDSVVSSRAWMTARRGALRAHVDLSLSVPTTVESEALRSAILGAYDPRPLQSEALARTPSDDDGLWICAYPTGDGKTEAALLRHAAHPDEGLFFGLPTMATTDAMEVRLARLNRELGGQFPIQKAHGMANLQRSTSPAARNGECAESRSDWYSTSIRKIVAPNVAGTVDQALAGALARKHITFRLFGLANRHVVIDEVHTLDVYQTELLIELLYWWGLTQTRVTLLSATLADSHVALMVHAYKCGLAGEEFTSTPEPLSVSFPSTVSVRLDGKVEHRSPTQSVRQPEPTVFEIEKVADPPARTEAHITWARRKSAAYPGSPIAVITNTIGDCVEIASALASDPEVAATHDILCLHSGLVAGHRRAAEATLIAAAGMPAHERGFGIDAKPVLVVGTQVIQASLDFDVDFVSTSLSPAPDLLQRLGRCWRFEEALGDATLRKGRLPLGTHRTMHVVAAVNDVGRRISQRSAAPYLSAVLDRTLRALEREQGESSEPIDLFEFSQRWVNAAFDGKDPQALLDEATSDQEIEEHVDRQDRLGSSDLSRAALGRSTAGGRNTPLLPPARSRRGEAKWSDLCRLTTLPLDENASSTRFIERESIRVLLIDSTGEAFYIDPESGQSVGFPQLTVDELQKISSEEACRLFSSWIMSVPAAKCSKAEAAVDRTLASADGPSGWEPRAKILSRVRPLDLKFFDGTYDPVTGLA